ncbi:sulfatase/phosphatase domain-containing protein [Verrucomicrobium spinosum]|uniref:sulfatase/phosphatase domain-containing protein n=1 Tax=Verrucomicrobium spinosum TaxID=2736 RepID=UPI00094675E2|nr:sulfatase/phosphatase domain-containing protein [Verrucomicrobium spinosum]
MTQASGSHDRVLAHRPALELYDLKNDPHELNNLAADPEQAERVKTLRTELDEWRREQRELMNP